MRREKTVRPGSACLADCYRVCSGVWETRGGDAVTTFCVYLRPLPCLVLLVLPAVGGQAAEASGEERGRVLGSGSSVAVCTVTLAHDTTWSARIGALALLKKARLR